MVLMCTIYVDKKKFSFLISFTNSSVRVIYVCIKAYEKKMDIKKYRLVFLIYIKPYLIFSVSLICYIVNITKYSQSL